MHHALVIPAMREATGMPKFVVGFLFTTGIEKLFVLGQSIELLGVALQHSLFWGAVASEA